jgi:hypothetical protein
MEQNEPDPAIFRRMLSNLLTPEMQGAMGAIEAEAGFRLPIETRQGFLRFHTYITTEPAPLSPDGEKTLS